MYLFVALACIIKVSSASLCCVPPQWETQGSFLTNVNLDGKSYLSRGTITMAYDAVTRRIGQYESIIVNDRPELNLGVLLDFNTNTKYVINNAGTCYKEVLDRDAQEFGGCIPDNATVVGTQDVVGFGNNDMNVNTYRMDFGPFVSAIVSLTSDGCVPVVETIRGTLEDGVTFMQNNHYWNLTAGITDPSNLQVPPRGCESAEMFKPAQMHAGVNSIFGRKRSFLGL